MSVPNFNRAVHISALKRYTKKPLKSSAMYHSYIEIFYSQPTFYTKLLSFAFRCLSLHCMLGGHTILYRILSEDKALTVQSGSVL